MDIKKYIILFIIMTSCISPKKDGISIEIHNDTSKDILIIDEYSFKADNDIELYDEGYDIKKKNKIILLKNNYITRYTIKDIYYYIDDFRNKEYIYLYIIKENYLKEKKTYIREKKLYDSIVVYRDKNKQEIYYEGR